MTPDLEAPSGDPANWPDQLYRARGDEIAAWRPVFTGDVFKDIPLLIPTGEMKIGTIMVIQHPCSMRTDGLKLTPAVLVGEVRHHRPLQSHEWSKFGKLMPLPDLFAEIESNKRHQAVMFDALRVGTAVELRPERRVACLTQLGINLLLQRWVHHSTRVVVPTSDINVVISGVFEEADLMEDWCEEAIAVGVSESDAVADCLAWLREDLGDGRMRQRMLEDAQNRSSIRKEMRVHVRKRYSS